MTEQLKICVTRRSDDFHACIEGQPKIWGCGQNVCAALGDLVNTHAERFGIEVLSVRSRNGQPLTSTAAAPANDDAADLLVDLRDQANTISLLRKQIAELLLAQVREREENAALREQLAVARNDLDAVWDLVDRPEDDPEGRPFFMKRAPDRKLSDAVSFIFNWYRDQVADGLGGANIIDGKLQSERADHAENRAKIARLAPVVKALHAWQTADAPLAGVTDGSSTLTTSDILRNAFIDWQHAEATALDSDAGIEPGIGPEIKDSP